MLLILLTSAGTLGAQSLDVGTIERPPFSFADSDGNLTGFSVELWQEIANRAKLDFSWVQHEQFSSMVDATVSGTTDLAIANITITAAREQQADFSQPIFQSGMAIAVAKGQKRSILSLIWESGILWFLGGALGLVFLIANIVWFFERGVEDSRHDYFRDDYIGGVWDAFWWAFIIMTMGGFENEVPQKIVNRVLAMFWIITSLFFISTLTAKITTSLTVAELKTGIESVNDLAGTRVGVTAGSTHQAYLDDRNIATSEFATLDEMYAALEAGTLDAIVADFPILSYAVNSSTAGWMMLAGKPFNPDSYGILAPENSNLIESIDQALLSLKEDGTYDEIYASYFGSEAR